MAVTRIWRIRGDASAPIDYVENPEKTRNDYSEEDRQALVDVIEYAANENKTEQRFFTCGINCNVNAAKNQFVTVKKRFGKEGGIVAYHCYQSFEEGETTPAQAHEIGKKLAAELWGDRFQVIVATHLNTKHLHNHFVINSVSFKEGLRFHNCRDRYTELRDASDRICKEHGLSVIENTKAKRVNPYLYKMEQAEMPTRYNVARQAIDEAVALSLNMQEFQYELKKRGYIYSFNPKHKYWSITPPGWKKNIRTYKLGENYTKEKLMERVYYNDSSVRTERLREAYKRPNNYNLKRRIDNIMGRSGLEKLYLRYCYELGYLPKYNQKPTKLNIILKEDLLKCEMYSEEAKLLSRNHIATDEDLSFYVKNLDEKMESLLDQREDLRKKVKRKITESERQEAKEKIAEITSKLKEIRKEQKLCEDIEGRSENIKENLRIVDAERSVKKKEVREI